MRTTPVALRGISAIAVVAAGLTLTACGSKNADVPAGPPAAAPASPSPSASVAANAASDPAGSSSVPGTALKPPTANTSAPAPAGTADTAGRACPTSQLKITAGNFDSGAGSTNFQIDFQNTGTTSCTLIGFPGVSFTTAKGAQLGNAADRVEAAKGAVTLRPNGHAVSDARAVNGQSGYSEQECGLTSAEALRIFPPNQKDQVVVPWQRDECVGPTIHNLRVGPVHTG